MNDPTLAYVILATIIALILGAIVFLQSRNNEANKHGEEPEPPPEPVARRPQGGNRAAANRNARARLRATLSERRGEELSEEDGDSDNEGPAAAQHSEDNSEEDMPAVGPALSKGKIGKKKLAKLQAKAEKKEQRLAEERERGEKKERDAVEEEEQRKKDEEQEEEEKVKLEEERKIEEERKCKELEEYEKMKAMFTVEDSGFDVNIDEDSEKDLLKEFVDYIKREKVVVLEELAARFRLKTQAVINRVNELQANETLTGVLDDRGKFIYISRSELETIATFIKQRGRITISELAEASGNLVSLTPDTETAAAATGEQCSAKA